MNPVEKIIEVLEKNGYEKKETSGISMAKGIHYIYEKPTGEDYMGLKWDYISYDNNYDDLLWEMDRRLYKLYNEGE